LRHHHCRSSKVRLAILFAIAAAPAFADGFAVTDLTQAPDMVPVMGAGFISKVEPDRVTLVCFDCAGAPMIDILMGRQTDGTEDRLRSGETTMADMEAICQGNDPACELEALSVDPAVGFVTTYPVMGKNGSTTVVMLGGDMLTIRSLADDPAIAVANGKTLLDNLLPALISR
jgi:hypothetical protein